MNVLQRGVSMRGVRELTNDEVRRLEAEWNGVFTKLGVLQGQLKSRRKALAGPNGALPTSFSAPFSRASAAALTMPEARQAAHRRDPCVRTLPATNDIIRFVNFREISCPPKRRVAIECYGMAKLTKRDIVVAISNQTGMVQHEVFEVVQRTLDHITDSLAKNVAVELRNFGVFQPRLTKPRVGRNPNEPGSSFVIPPRATVKFKAGKMMRQRVEKLSRELKEASEKQRRRRAAGRRRLAPRERRLAVRVPLAAVAAAKLAPARATRGSPVPAARS